MSHNEVAKMRGEVSRRADRRNVTADQLAARANLSSQRAMVRTLAQIREASQMSEAALAEAIGATEEIVEQIENFEYDLSLTELRHLAIALDAIVEVKVYARNAAEYTRSVHRQLEDLLRGGGQRVWRNMESSHQQRRALNEMNFGGHEFASWATKDRA
jgi:hypothetical protein